MRKKYKKMASLILLCIGKFAWGISLDFFSSIILELKVLPMVL